MIWPIPAHELCTAMAKGMLKKRINTLVSHHSGTKPKEFWQRTHVSRLGVLQVTQLVMAGAHGNAPAAARQRQPYRCM